MTEFHVDEALYAVLEDYREEISSVERNAGGLGNSSRAPAITVHLPLPDVWVSGMLCGYMTCGKH